MDNNQYDGYDVTQPQYGQQPYEQAGQPVYQQPYEQAGQPMYQQSYEQAGQPMYQQSYEQAGQPMYQQPYGQPGQPMYGQPPYQQNPYGGYPMQTQSSGLGTASLVLGIISLVCIWLTWGDLLFMLLADIFGRKAKKKNPFDSNAKAGILCSNIAAGIFLALIILSIWIVNIQWWS